MGVGIIQELARRRGVAESELEARVEPLPDLHLAVVPGCAAHLGLGGGEAQRGSALELGLAVEGRGGPHGDAVREVGWWRRGNDFAFLQN